MAVKKWNIANPDCALAKNLAAACEADPFVALIASTRGISDPAEFDLFLSDEPVLADPFMLEDIEKAANAVNSAIEENKKIAVFGDYDCDGVTSTAMLYDYLLSRGAKAVTYIPDRISEGYGMNKAAIDKLKEQNVELIITVDNGIAAIDEIEYANKMGIKTVVTDHHIPQDILPEAEAVVDPHRVDDPSGFKEICGAAVVFKLICVTADKEPEQMLKIYGDLLALATVGDVMPLVDENRCMVKYGLKMIKNNSRPGLNALISVAGLNRKDIDSLKLSFGLVPRINAAGRMGNASRALNLLLCKDNMLSLSLANEIDAENARRQELEKKISSKAFEIIEQNGFDHNRVIIVSGKNWHSGVLGIVSARVTEKYGRPSIVLTEEGGVCHGSGRSFKGFNIFKSLESCSDLLLKFGGHELAAGVTLSSDNIDKFREKINEYARKSEIAVQKLNIDLKLNPAALGVDMAYAIKALEPFGQGNPVPMFAITDCVIDRIIPIGSGKHLKLMLRKNETVFQAVMFGVKEEDFCFECSDKVDIAVTVGLNYYKDEYNLTVQIKNIRPSDFDEDSYFKTLFELDDYLSGYSKNTALIVPSRDEVGIIYKNILNKKINKERIKFSFAGTLGIAKTCAALSVLKELGLAKCENNRYTAVNTGVKTSLENSKIYNRLKGGERIEQG